MLSISRKPMQQQALRNLRRPLNLCAWTGWTGTACTVGVPVVILSVRSASRRQLTHSLENFRRSVAGRWQGQ